MEGDGESIIPRSPRGSISREHRSSVHEMEGIIRRSPRTSITGEHRSSVHEMEGIASRSPRGSLSREHRSPLHEVGGITHYTPRGSLSERRSPHDGEGIIRSSPRGSISLERRPSQQEIETIVRTSPRPSLSLERRPSRRTSILGDIDLSAISPTKHLSMLLDAAVPIHETLSYETIHKEGMLIEDPSDPHYTAPSGEEVAPTPHKKKHKKKKHKEHKEEAAPPPPPPMEIAPLPEPRRSMTPVIEEIKPREISGKLSAKELRKMRPPQFWKPSPSHVYQDNAVFGFSAYQPMIEYLNTKDKGVDVPPPYIPFLNERWMSQHRREKPTPRYTRSQVEGYMKMFKKHHNAFATKNAARTLALMTETEKQDWANINSVMRPSKPKDTLNMRKFQTKAQCMGDLTDLESSMKHRIHMKADELLSQANYAMSIGRKIEAWDLARPKKSKIARMEEDQEMANETDEFLKRMEKRQAKMHLETNKMKELLQHAHLFCLPESKGKSDYDSFRSFNPPDPKTDLSLVPYKPQHNTSILPLDFKEHDFSFPSLKKYENKYMCDMDAEEFEAMKPIKPKVEIRPFVGDPEKDDLKRQVKQMTIEIEQLNIRIQEIEVKMKTEIARIKKKMQIQITELEMSLDVANKNNIELQKTIKKQSLQLTELSGQYDELQRQLQVTLDQLGVSQRRVQALTAELEDMRGNLDAAMRAKRAVEVQCEEFHTRCNELTTINVNISSAKAKIEQEFSILSADYDELTKELKMADDRVQKAQAELKHTIDILHEEQERVVKIETIKKSLEVEVKNLTIRLEEVEANAIVGGKRVISKLEARIRDLEMELDEEKRRHAESIKILRKKERYVKEVMIQCEEDRTNMAMLQDACDKLQAKINIYKRQLQETEGLSAQNVTRVRRFQRELEAAEERAESAESNLSLIRAKHRSFVTSSQAPGISQTYIVEEHHTRESL